VTLGLQVVVSENGVRKTYRARYYNTMTGRFVSMDPEDGIPTDPKTLHKYIYAHGDPVNLSDPTGRAAAAPTMPGTAGGDIGEYGAILLSVAVRAIPAAVAVGCAVRVQYSMDALAVDGYTDIIPWGFCSAKGRRKCTCTASCTCHVIGMPDHGNTGQFVFGSGTASSCPAARTLAKQDAGMGCAPGSHAQHCGYDCTQ
jgi:RHS repeat-associated protein